MTLTQLRTRMDDAMTAAQDTLQNDARYQWLKAHLAPQAATLLTDGSVQYVLTVTLTSATLPLDLDALIDAQLTQTTPPAPRRRALPKQRKPA
jgi:hypothetical protein